MNPHPVRQTGRLVFCRELRSAGTFAMLVVLAGCTLFEPTQKNVGNPATVRSAVPTIPAQDVYRLQPGDVINVFVFDNPELSQSAVIAPDGRLSYPLAGTITAKERSLSDIQTTLTHLFSKNIIAPQVSVSLLSIAPHKIFVNGEVVQPGAFDLQEPVTLVQAISLAGGFTAFARRDRILVYNPTRSGGARREFNFDSFVSDPRAQDIMLRPGDTIIVR